MSVAARLEAADWRQVAESLDERGSAVIAGLLDAQQCGELVATYQRPEAFRSRVVMARHGFGRGEYRYLSYPLPPLVAELRSALYTQLAPIATAWHAALGIDVAFPTSHREFVERCHAAGQVRPTPLILRYGPGDYNCLHQDLYGEHVFPLQVAVLLSQPGRDHDGGEFVMTEQRPRMQSRVNVVPMERGDAVVFAVSGRPRTGARGIHRVNMRHGVSEVRSGERYAMGVIMHDAA